VTPSLASVEADTQKQRSYMAHGRAKVSSRSLLSLPAEKNSNTPLPSRPRSVRTSNVALMSPLIEWSTLDPKLLVMTSAPGVIWAGNQSGVWRGNPSG
jgi:hypothetical protein